MVLLGATLIAPAGASGIESQGAIRLQQEAAAERVVQFETEAADGTMLRGDVHIPAGDRPRATVLMLSPYWNTAAKGPSESQSSDMIDALLKNDFAVALVNLRGTGESGGCFQFGGQLDWSDAYAVVEGLAEQPWSNGNVGMQGISYEGWSQYMAMASHPPSLKAVVPESGVIDVWSLLTRQGAPIHIGPATSGVFGAATSLASLEPQLAEHNQCQAEFAEHIAQGGELVTTGDHTDYYGSRDLRPHIQNSEVPAFVANGLRFFDEGHTLQFEDLWKLLDPDRTRFMLGQWGHAYPGAFRDDYETLVVDWFDHYLRGGPQQTESGVVEYQDDSGAWHTTQQWPPDAHSTALQMSGQELSRGQRPGAPTSQTFQSADLDTGHTCGPHQAVYVSPPLAEDILVAGNFSIDATLSSTLSGGNLVATLLHTPADGSCADLLSQAKESGRMQLDLRHWKTPGASKEFPTATPTQVSADSIPLATRIPAGDRLVLAIGAGSVELEPDPLKPEISILTGGRATSTLNLPLVKGNLRFRPSTN